jgi:hypothetical protein
MVRVWMATAIALVALTALGSTSMPASADTCLTGDLVCACVLGGCPDFPSGPCRVSAGLTRNNQVGLLC